jgi:hypothetical protein
MLAIRDLPYNKEKIMKLYLKMRSINLVSVNALARKMVTLFVASVVVTFVVTMNASLAQASDAKWYPGSMCVPIAFPGFSSATPNYRWSAIENPDREKPMLVDCPLIHDSPKSIYDGKLRVVDAHNGLQKVPTNVTDVECVLVSSSGPNALKPHLESLKISSKGYNSDGTVQLLDFPNDKFHAIGDAHYYFSCKIPPSAELYDETGQKFWRSSKIVSYFLEEHE